VQRGNPHRSASTCGLTVARHGLVQPADPLSLSSLGLTDLAGQAALHHRV
jgi:hypothetical protein